MRTNGGSVGAEGGQLIVTAQQEPRQASGVQAGSAAEAAAAANGATTQGAEVGAGEGARAPRPQLVRLGPAGEELALASDVIRVRVRPDTRSQRVYLDARLSDVTVSAGGDSTEKDRVRQTFWVAMPGEVEAASSRTARQWLQADVSSLPGGPTIVARLAREMLVTENEVVSEIHARASFGVSCFILVLVGCALGMMFRSGHFLSAFAVSVVPAMLCIMLIVTGQHTAENVPSAISASWQNTLPTGLALIWSGNVAVLAIAAALGWRLQRT